MSNTSSSTFSKALTLLRKHEGFYAFVSGDLGQETYIGIARRFHPNWQGWAIIDTIKRQRGVDRLKHNERVNHPDMDRLVATFYKTQFWDTGGFDKVRNESVALILFDAYMGQTGGFMWMIQLALKRCGLQAYANTSDSPPRSLPAYRTAIIADVNSVDAALFFRHFKDVREQYFRFRAGRPNQGKFLEGWLNRLGTYSFAQVMTQVEDALKKKEAGF